MSIVKFDYEKFEASVKAGNPIQLCDSKDEPDPVEFVGIAHTKKGIQIVGIHNGLLDSWKTSGSYGVHTTEKSSLDLQMILTLEPERDLLAEYEQWYYDTQSIKWGGLSDSIKAFRAERSAGR